MTQPKLKPCPFCGGEGELCENISMLVSVRCVNKWCIASMLDIWYFNRIDAARAWNKRAFDKKERKKDA